MDLNAYWVTIAGMAGSWFLVTGLIWKLFDRVEKTATDEGRKMAMRWTRGLVPGASLKKLSELFADSFDSVFGSKHFSGKCFVRSCLASYLCVLVVALIWASLRPDEFKQILLQMNNWDGASEIAYTFLIVTVVFNILPDYLSLLQTRIIVKLLKKENNMFALWIFIDIVLTALLAVSAWLFIWSIPISSGGTFSYVIDEYFEVIFHAASLSSMKAGHLTPGIFFYSTFFTSVWLWLYILSMPLLKTASKLDGAFSFLKRFFFREDQPFISLGAISIVIVTFIYIVALPFVLIF